MDAGPAPASLPGAAALPGGGGIIPLPQGGWGAGAPVARGAVGGWGDGGGFAPWLPTSPLWGGGVRKRHCHVFFFLGGLDPGQAPLKTLLLMLRLT